MIDRWMEEPYLRLAAEKTEAIPYWGKRRPEGFQKKRKGKVRFPEVRSLKETGNNQRSEGVAGPLPGVSQVADRGRPFKYDRYREIIPGADQN